VPRGIHAASAAVMAMAALFAQPGWAADDPVLRMEQVAEGTFAFIGEQTGFTPENAGNMMNAGFIVTRDGVVVIDTGLTRKIGQAMLDHIRGVTGAPVRLVLNTHFHPDHSFGNVAFAERGVPIQATPAARAQLAGEGPALLENIHELIGPGAEGTALALPEPAITGERTLEIGGHRIALLLFGHAHTDSDLAVFDETTGVLFAGDLVFQESAPATPNADLAGWSRALRRLEALPWRKLVPGHGPVIANAAQLRVLMDYLLWLPGAIDQAVARGDDMNDLLARPIPAPFDALALSRWQYQRSVLKFFPEREMEFFETGQ
jgi:quinoprotein relay system zinc metallohydrolase 1